MKLTSYSAESIQVLEGLEAVRKTPGMYIGSTDSKGLHHLVWEILDNSIDEAVAGFANEIKIIYHQDGSIEIEDNGRGIPTGIHPTKNVSGVEVVLTSLHAGGKFDSNTYKVSGGLHGVGASVVNALSKKLEVWIKTKDHIYYQEYANGGSPQTPLKKIKDKETNETGTTIRFYPDEAIFDTIEFDFQNINDRAKQLAYLNKGISLELTNKKENLYFKYFFKNGLIDYINEINKNKDVLFKELIYDDVEVKKTSSKDHHVINTIGVEFVMQYNTSYSSNISSFANNITTIEGGTHEQGFFDALVRILNNYINQFKKIKTEKKNVITREDLKEGLTAIISVRHTDPIFEGQTKNKLGNKDAREAVNRVVSGVLSRFLDENPDKSELIIKKILEAQKARFAAQKAREETRKNDEFQVTSLPGKLTDCASNKPEECELYIVEGDSAGGSAKLGRDRKIQAILPLRGKIINVEKARVNKVFENNEILSLITALRTGVNEDFNIEKLRYHKIIIMTDADVDGSHIRILLLTFFYRYFFDLVEKGYIYIAQPPLYRVQVSKNNLLYCYSDKEKDDYIKTLSEKTRFSIQRYKGLGEMDAEQLWETTMDPEKRKMIKIQVEDTEKANTTFSALMGEEVEPRKVFINLNAKFATNIDL